MKEPSRFYSSLGLLFAISGGFKQLAIISSAATLLIYLGVVLATIKLRRADVGNSEKTFRVPGGISIPLLAVGAIVWLLSNLTKAELFGIVIFIFIFSLIYLSTRLLKNKQLK